MLISVFLPLLPVLILLGALFVWKWWNGRDRRRDPLNIKILRGAGQSVREALDHHSSEFDTAAFTAFIAGPIVYIAWASRWMKEAGFQWSSVTIGFFEVFLLVALTVAYVLYFRKLTKHGLAARRYRQALAAELATAQCLTQVMAEGGLVFHDFPGDGFNIDHIVIGRSVVFAVETKSRRKPASEGKDAARVVYDGSSLRFPEHIEKQPLEQAARQAEWLAGFLARGVGEPVRVVPYLALPGWFIENKVQRPAVLVGNPRNPMFMVRDGFGPPLGEQMKQRIAHVLSERYPANSDSKS